MRSRLFRFWRYWLAASDRAGNFIGLWRVPQTSGISAAELGTQRELRPTMTRIAVLGVVLAGCTATTYPYQGSRPLTYAETQQQQQVAQSQDGTTTTTTTTSSSYSFQPQAAQPAAYEPAPPPPPPPAEPGPAPSLCHPRDTPNMCVAITVMVDIGDILTDVREASCRDAARSLNRYADAHPREIDTLVRLQELEPAHKLARWEERNRSRAEPIMMAALDLDTRCDGNAKVDRALRRVGFTGMIGSPAL
jgi:hypothetical protein